MTHHQKLVQAGRIVKAEPLVVVLLCNFSCWHQSIR